MCADILTDETLLKGRLEGTNFIVQANGTEPSIVEIVEQLAWLGAVLRSSPFDSDVAICTPRISKGPFMSISDQETETSPSTTIGISLEMDFSFTRSRLGATNESNQCWNRLFVNPVMVQGFPLPRRPNTTAGLEISLDILAALVQAQGVTQYNASILIKGFSAVAVPTDVQEEVILWHLIVNDDANDRISYNDDRIHACLSQQSKDLQVASLNNFRHILGWCAPVESYLGKENLHLVLRTFP